MAGSPAEKDAADYIASQLRAFGYGVEEQTFSFEAFIDLGTTLEVLSPEARSLEPLPLEPTIGGLAEGEILAAGLGRPQEFTADIVGKIALIERGQIFFSDKVANAAAAGALAVIIYNNEPGQFLGQLSGPPAIPAVSISREEGQLLLDLLERGPVKVRLDLQVESGPRNSQNVVARPADGQCRIYVGGHYDSVAIAPGANDNASGTATVIEIARVLASDGQLEDVCFIAFGAEEVGLIGSGQFVSALSMADRGTILGLLNFDVVGAGSRWLLGGSPALTEIAGLQATRLGLTFVEGDLPSGTSSDHASFIAAGIPALIISRLGDSRIHSAADRPESLDPLLLGEAGRLGLAIIDALLEGQ